DGCYRARVTRRSARRGDRLTGTGIAARVAPVRVAAKPRRWVYAAAAAWLVVTTTCMVLVWRYKARPGDPADAPRQWPATGMIARDVALATLVMFAHPECPCTAASLEELAAVMSRVGGRVTAWVVFVRPHEVGEQWNDTSTRRRAEQLPGVSVMIDDDGREAARFGARVSGQVLLYDE